MLYLATAVERAMKVQEVILRALSGALTWLQAADILGIHPRGASAAGGLAMRLTGSWASMIAATADPCSGQPLGGPGRPGGRHAVSRAFSGTPRARI